MIGCNCATWHYSNFCAIFFQTFYFFEPFSVLSLVPFLASHLIIYCIFALVHWDIVALQQCGNSTMLHIPLLIAYNKQFSRLSFMINCMIIQMINRGHFAFLAIFHTFSKVLAIFWFSQLFFLLGIFLPKNMSNSGFILQLVLL